MKLRTGSAVRLFTVMAILGIALFAVVYLVVGRIADRVEEEDVDQQAMLLEHVFTSRVAALEVNVADWALWDDTYFFANGTYPEFPEENLSPIVLANLEIDVIAVFRKDGSPYYTQSIDRHTVEPAHIPGIETLLEDNPELASANASDEAAAGVVTLEDGRTMIVSTQPILRTDRSGPSLGVLLMGTIVDDQLAVRLSEFLDGDVTLCPLDHDTEAHADLPLEVLGPNLVSGSVEIPGLDGATAIVMTFMTDRADHKAVTQTLPALSLSLMVLVVLSSLAVGMAVDRTVLRRVESVARQVNDIRATGNLQSVSIEGADEISELAEDIDAMVESLEHSRAELRDARADLEKRVELRTAELQKSNDALEDAVQDLEASNAALEDASLAKSRFLANMSHELRTPLNSIIGFSTVLSQGLAGPLNDEQLTQIGMVKHSGVHLLNLINDVLDLAKVEAGGTEVTIAPFNVVETVHEVVTTIRPLAQEKDLELNLKCDVSDIQANSDSRKLRQVLLNLLGNAVKFTETGGVTLSITHDVPGIVSFSVTDTGPGIPDEALRRIFNTFVQIDIPDRVKPQGTGLGLALSREYARLLGGEIAVYSDVDVGSSFSLVMPLDLANGPV